MSLEVITVKAPGHCVAKDLSTSDQACSSRISLQIIAARFVVFAAWQEIAGTDLCYWRDNLVETRFFAIDIALGHTGQYTSGGLNTASGHCRRHGAELGKRRWQCASSQSNKGAGIDTDQGRPCPVVGNDTMVLFRGIFLLLLLIGLFMAAAGEKSFASTPIPAMQHSAENHDAIKLTTSNYCKLVKDSSRHGSSHDGCCRDINCGSCAQPDIAALTSIDVPTLRLDEHANATAITPMVGRNIAPEGDPPKHFA